MKNIAVALDDDVYRRARIRAAELETSVSALVRKFSIDLASGESGFERLKREESLLREKIDSFSSADRLSRDDLYERHR